MLQVFGVQQAVYSFALTIATSLRYDGDLGGARTQFFFGMKFGTHALSFPSDQIRSD